MQAPNKTTIRCRRCHGPTGMLRYINYSVPRSCEMLYAACVHNKLLTRCGWCAVLSLAAPQERVSKLYKYETSSAYGFHPPSKLALLCNLCPTTTCTLRFCVSSALHHSKLDPLFHTERPQQSPQ